MVLYKLTPGFYHRICAFPPAQSAHKYIFQVLLIRKRSFRKIKFLQINSIWKDLAFLFELREKIYYRFLYKFTSAKYKVRQFYFSLISFVQIFLLIICFIQMGHFELISEFNFLPVLWQPYSEVKNQLAFFLPGF